MTQTQSREHAVIPEADRTDLKEQEHDRSNDTLLLQNDVDEDESLEQEDAPKPGNPKRRFLLVMGGCMILLAGSIIGWRWWQFQQTHASTDNAQIQGHLSPLSSKIPATVQQTLVKEGEPVRAGQPLLILEDQDLQLKVKQAEAALAIAQAQLAGATDTVRVTNQTNPIQVQQSQAKLAASVSAIDAAQANVAQAQAQIETRQAVVAQAQTEVDKTQADYRRYESLYQAGAVSAQQFESARAAYENARANLAATLKTGDQAQAEFASAQAQLQASVAEANAAKGQVQETQVSGQTVTVQQDQQKQAQAQVAQAAAALALARQQLTYTVIKAPMDGYVGQFTAQVGQKVEAGQPLLSIVPLRTDEVYVEANFKETALGKLQIGEKAAIKVDAYPNETFLATIAGISPATGSSYALLPPDNATGNFNKVVQWVPVRLTFNAETDPQHKLRPGLNVTVTVDTTSTTSATSTPAKP
ncbi:MAG: HlyD family secretion protein [Scytolyngbya sp. HA4215-MV1]|jgi:membrane fusion protein (multidrug efflux system)|nr:HlyD family secretion protein [Scytolyngbya sp. HA4215-MV1]